MAVKHQITIIENLVNFPNYRFEGYCTCGFATKQATKTAVEDQMNHHLQVHGVNVETHTDRAVVLGEQAKKEWKPVGAK